MASVCLTASPSRLLPLKPSPFKLNSSSSSSSSPNNFNRISFRKFLSPHIVFKSARRFSTAASMSSSDGKTNEPLWKSFGKSIESFGKKPSVEDLLRQQIEKQEYYDEGGGGGKGSGGGRGGGGGGGGGFGEPEEEGISGIIEETIQVVLATLGFIFMYVYIINGAEMTRLAKDYITYLFGGRKSVRLTRALYQWERFCKNLTEKPQRDRFWLEKAIINTPTWWDSPEKYKLLLEALSPVQLQPDVNEDDDDDDMRDDYGSQASEEMSDGYY